MQDGKYGCRSLAARFSGIEPAHVGSSGELHSGLQNVLNQNGVTLASAVVAGDTVGSFGRRHGDGLVNLGPKASGKGRREVEENTFFAHGLELLVGHIVAVLNGVGACVNGDLDVRSGDSVNGNFQVLAMGLL